MYKNKITYFLELDKYIRDILNYVFEGFTIFLSHRKYFIFDKSSYLQINNQ